MQHSTILLAFGLLFSVGLQAQQPLMVPERKSAKSVRMKKRAAAAKPAPKQGDLKRPGLFTVTKHENDWFFEIPDSLIGRRILSTTRYISTPAETGKFGGEQLNGQVLYFEKRDKDNLQLRADMVVNQADSTQIIYRATSVSNTNPLIGSFKIESHTGGRYKIKVTSFFNDDNPAIGMPQYVKRGYGITGQIPNLSYIEDIKSFPQNTEVRLVKTWASGSGSVPAASETGRLTFGLNISFVLLPQTPMRGRYFDPRVGYFATGFSQYSDDQQRVQNKTFVTRWRLEPKDSADAARQQRGELIEPKKPIVYYIDPATPKQWRKYLILGVNDWQKAFEQAGWKNAIQGREWPENDSTMSPEDARFSMIRYLASPIENAYGPNVHDPRSGEIIESHVCWYHNVMKLLHDWYFIQASTIDEAARSMKFDDELMGQLIRFVSSHEVGHTLGLRHNFGSSSTVPVDSLRSVSFVRAHGHTPSIMDYARFNYVAQPEDGLTREDLFPRVNDYDCWAIEWGYTPMPKAYDEESDHYELEKLFAGKDVSAKSRLWFGDGETNWNDPRCQTEDLGNDAVLASTYGLKNLKREVAQLPQWTYERNDVNAVNLAELYNQVRNQFYRYIGHVARNIGGIEKNFRTVDEQGDVYSATSKAHQLRALDWIDREVLTEPTWLLTDYVGRLFRERSNATTNMGTSTVSLLMQRLYNLNENYTETEYLSDLTRRLFKEADARQNVSKYRRTLQQTYVARLIDTFGSGNYRAETLQQLKAIKQKTAAAMTTGNAETRAHWADLNDRCSRALVIK